MRVALINLNIKQYQQYTMYMRLGGIGTDDDGDVGLCGQRGWPFIRYAHRFHQNEIRSKRLRFIVEGFEEFEAELLLDIH